MTTKPHSDFTPRTDEEIDSITLNAGDRIWLRNIRDSDDHAFIESFFTHHDSYSMGAISDTHTVILESNDGKFNEESLTIGLLDRVSEISEAIYSATREAGCPPWTPPEYIKFLRHFTSSSDNLESAIKLIRERSIVTFDELMRLHEALREGSAPALVNGAL